MCTSKQDILTLKNNVDQLVNDIFFPHPFSYGITLKNIKSLMGEFLAMSQYFPYIQAAAHQEIIDSYLESGNRIPYDVEATSVIAAFLCWDEFGGHHRIIKSGVKGLPEILKTNSFHSNILRADLNKLFGKNIELKFSDMTREYLKKLKSGLSAIDYVKRIAHMTAFERHAAIMLEALYSSIKTIYPDNKSLLYFELHVGGDDPAEVYHMEMTSNLIQNLLDTTQYGNFLQQFELSCEMHRNWSKSIKYMRGREV